MKVKVSPANCPNCGWSFQSHGHSIVDGWYVCDTDNMTEGRDSK